MTRKGLQETAQKVVEKGLIEKAADACGVSPKQVRGYAKGEPSDMKDHDLKQMKGVIEKK